MFKSIETTEQRNKEIAQMSNLIAILNQEIEDAQSLPEGKERSRIIIGHGAIILSLEKGKCALEKLNELEK